MISRAALQPNRVAAAILFSRFSSATCYMSSSASVPTLIGVSLHCEMYIS